MTCAIVDWANSNVGFVGLIYAFLTLVMVIAVTIGNSLTREMLHAHGKPDVNCDSRLAGDGLIHVSIRNDSPHAAYDVELKRGVGKKASPLTSCSYVGPNQAVDVPICSPQEFIGEPAKELWLTLSFRSETGKRYSVAQIFRADEIGGLKANEGV